MYLLLFGRYRIQLIFFVLIVRADEVVAFVGYLNDFRVFKVKLVVMMRIIMVII